MMGYPSEAVYEEVAFLAYYLGWTHDEIMKMDHRERQRWVEETARINRRLNDESER